MTGYVYIFTNPAMPEYIKVGRTNNIKQRLRDLSRPTSVPEPFECFAYLEIPAGCGATDASVEDGLHRILKKHLTHHKEFFKVSPHVVLDYFDSVCRINPALIIHKAPETDASSSVPALAKRTTFAMLGVPVGAVLAFRRDSGITCTVADPINRVAYKGSRYSISALAGELLHGRSVNGFEFFAWTGSDHPDETLAQRRRRVFN